MPIAQPFTSPDFIALFNRAAELARDGEYEASLAAWDALIDAPVGARRPGQRFMSGRFLGNALMRRAWVLMDLERYEAACARFEDVLMQACLAQFEPEELYEFYFSYANVLGALGRVRRMDRAMSTALSIAAEDLSDGRRCVLCWTLLLDHGRRAADWKYVAREARRATAFAQNIEEPFLEVEARLARRDALRHLGRASEARQEDLALHDLAVR